MPETFHDPMPGDWIGLAVVATFMSVFWFIIGMLLGGWLF